MGDLTAHFSTSEFKCKDGTPVPDQHVGNLRLLAMCLERIREVYDKPIKVISGYRTQAYNERCGGSKRSKHLEALAADFIIEGEHPIEIALKIEELIEAGELPSGCGIGVYQKRFTHFDPRPKRARWTG